MKSIEFTKYGAPEVLELKEVPKPVPEDNELLIKVCATTVTASECIFRKGKPYLARLFSGLFKPKITRLGEEFAGVVESVGKNVELFKEGDQIFGSAGHGFGANAEYLCIKETEAVISKPPGMSYEEAASSCDGFLTALPFLRDTGKIQSGQEVLINGASGSVGVAAVQVAKHYGAEVTGVCSTANVELVKSLGAKYAIDYTAEDFTKTGKTYDIIFDTVGKISFSYSKKALKETGVFLEAGVQLGMLPQVLWTKIFGKKKFKLAATGLRPNPEKIKDLMLLKEFLEQGKIRPVIDRSYPLEEIVDAHCYVDAGHKKGNVVITIS